MQALSIKEIDEVSGGSVATDYISGVVGTMAAIEIGEAGAASGMAFGGPIGAAIGFSIGFGLAYAYNNW